MYPTTHYEIAKARPTDLHAQAQRDVLARAARQARRAQRHHPASALPAVGHRVLTVLGARST